MIRNSICLRATTTVLIILVACAPSFANRTNAGSHESDRPEYRHRVELQVGYFTGRREIFRQLYGDAIAFGARYQRLGADGLSYGLRAGFTKLRQSDGAPSLLSISLAPVVSYDLQRSRQPRIFASAGVGLSRRAISMDLPKIIGYQKVRQTELSVFALVELGADLRLGPRWSLGGRVCYDFFPFGDPTLGDFGDTGGLYFLGGVIHDL